MLDSVSERQKQTAAILQSVIDCCSWRGAKRKSVAVINGSASHLSEVNGSDKIIRAPSPVHRCHLDQSLNNCPSFQRPIFFTQYLQQGQGVDGQDLSISFVSCVFFFLYNFDGWALDCFFKYHFPIFVVPFSQALC